jgi:hypothetical protein
MKTMNFIRASHKSKFSGRRLTPIQTWEIHNNVSNILSSLDIPFKYDINDSFIIKDDYVDDFFFILKDVIEKYFGINYEDDLDELLDFFSNLQN